MALGRSMRFLLGAIGTAAFLAGGPASAQAPDSTLEQQFDAAFQQMLRDPSNLDNTFKYAELAIRIGDYEAAISALERMLLFNPDLPRVRLELGVLYFRLGSYAISRTYLTRALEGDDVPDDVRARVATYLAEIEKRTSRHRFAGSFYGGARYQTNANAGPNSTAISLLGVEANLDSEFTEMPDWNLFASGSVRYTYDPQLQTGEVLQADLLLYGAEQFEQGQLDLLYAELKIGPRGQFWPEMIEGVSYRPYVLGQQTLLDDTAYFRAFGGGFNLAKQFGPIISGEANLEHIVKNYHNSEGRPTLENQDGAETELRLDMNFALGPTSLLSLGGSVKTESAEESLFSNIEYLLTASYTMSYAIPIEDLPTDRWTSSFSITRVWTSYHEPDPAVDPVKNRSDQEWRWSFLTSVPVSENWAIIGTVQRTMVDSNFRNFNYNNTSASIGASYRF